MKTCWPLSREIRWRGETKEASWRVLVERRAAGETKDERSIVVHHHREERCLPEGRNHCWRESAGEKLAGGRLFSPEDGSLPMPTREPAIKRLSEIPSPKNGPTVSPLQAPLSMANNSVAPRGKDPSRNSGNLEPIVKQMEITPNGEHPATSQRSSEVLERARTAIAVVERATAAARAAAELVNVKSGMSGQQWQTFRLNQVPRWCVVQGNSPSKSMYSVSCCEE